MRYFLLLALSVTTLTSGIGESTITRFLVTPGGSSAGLTPSLGRTARGTVTMATIAGLADQALGVAAGAIEQAG